MNYTLKLLEKPVVLVKKSNSVFFRSVFATYDKGYSPAAVLRVCLGEKNSHKGEKFRWATRKGIDFIKSGDTPGVREDVILF